MEFFLFNILSSEIILLIFNELEIWDIRRLIFVNKFFAKLLLKKDEKKRNLYFEYLLKKKDGIRFIETELFYRSKSLNYNMVYELITSLPDKEINDVLDDIVNSPKFLSNTRLKKIINVYLMINNYKKELSYKDSLKYYFKRLFKEKLISKKKNKK